VWSQGPPGAGDVHSRAVDAAGALSATVAIAATAADEDEPDVGGDAGLADHRALVAWIADGDLAARETGESGGSEATRGTGARCRATVEMGHPRAVTTAPP
jgi:hypothetical protein